MLDIASFHRYFAKEKQEKIFLSPALNREKKLKLCSLICIIKMDWDTRLNEPYITVSMFWMIFISFFATRMYRKPKQIWTLLDIICNYNNFLFFSEACHD